MPEVTDEQMRLLEALEPFRQAASKAAYEQGIQQGILRVYNGMLQWCVRGDDHRHDHTHEERSKRLRATEVMRVWMEDRYPIILETYPKKND